MKTSKAIVFGLALSVFGELATAAELEVRISNVAHERGNVRVTLYAGPEGFRHEERSLRVIEQPAAAGPVTVRFNDLATGSYAVIAYHDENGDGTLNRFLGMVPTEGYGLSNNPKLMGPPRFDDAALQLEADASIEVRLNY